MAAFCFHSIPESKSLDWALACMRVERECVRQRIESSPATRKGEGGKGNRRAPHLSRQPRPARQALALRRAKPWGNISAAAGQLAGQTTPATFARAVQGRGGRTCIAIVIMITNAAGLPLLFTKLRGREREFFDTCTEISREIFRFLCVIFLD
jgi:hypothetical protein